MDKSVNTNAAHVCTFYETKTVFKEVKCDAYTFFCGTSSHNQCCHCWGFFMFGVFLFHLGFWVFLENLRFVLLWSNLRNVCCINVFSIQEDSRSIGVMCRVSTVEQS